MGCQQPRLASPVPLDTLIAITLPGNTIRSDIQPMATPAHSAASSVRNGRIILCSPSLQSGRLGTPILPRIGPWATTCGQSQSPYRRMSPTPHDSAGFDDYVCLACCVTGNQVRTPHSSPGTPTGHGRRSSRLTAAVAARAPDGRNGSAVTYSDHWLMGQLSRVSRPDHTSALCCTSTLKRFMRRPIRCNGWFRLPEYPCPSATVKR